MKEKIHSGTVELASCCYFTKQQMDGISRVTKILNVSTNDIVKEAVLEYLQNCYPDLRGWRIPRSLFVTLVVPKLVKNKLEHWRLLKHKMEASFDEHGILLLLDETGLREYNHGQRLTLLKVPASWEKETAATSPTEVSP